MTIINGTSGNDTLTSTGPGDTLVGGAGDDVYVVNDASDVVVEQANSGAITRISTDSLGTQANGNSIQPVLSPDGTKVVFTSAASNLVTGDSNALEDIFVKDLVTGALTLVSSNASGVGGNGGSHTPVFTADGGKVVFSSGANNLVAGDSNGVDDIFIKDLTTGAVMLVSTDSSAVQGNGASSVPVVSADGSKVAFVSSANNLIPDDSNSVQDIFVKNLTTGVLTRITTDSTGAQDNGASYTPVFSPDGSKVAFVSDATNLVAGDTNGASDIFIKDLVTGAVSLISTDSSNVQGNSSSLMPVFSPDGSKVAFISYARLLGSDNNLTSDIYVKDLTTGALTLVTTSALGVQANGYSTSPVFSADGTKLTFVSYSNNLVSGADNGVGEVFVKDLVTGTVTLVSSDAFGVQSNDNSISSSISANGSVVAFASNASNLVHGDSNFASDIFIKHLTGGGIDTVQSSVSYTLSANVDNLTLTGTANINGTGNNLYNVITGNSGNNTLDGGFGNDTLIGGAGDDVYLVDNVNDKVVETNDGTIALFSTDAGGTPGNAASDQPVASLNGSQVAFTSLATDLASNATNGAQQIFSKDTATGVVTLVSSSATGVQGDAYSFAPAISADGTQVAFTSTSDNLVVGDTNAANDIFVKNITTGAVTLVSTSSTGVQANDYSGTASISADGSKVAFVSYATNLVAGDTNAVRDIFVKDLTTGTTTLVSSSSAGVEGNDFSELPSISPDGTKVVFASAATNLVAGDTNGEEDIFMKDLTTGALTLISADINGVQGVRDSNTPIFSPDGSKVAFLSSSGNLVAGSFSGYQKLFIKDLATGAVTLVSSATDGTQPDGYTFAAAFSPDGTKMAFASYADNLVAGDTNGQPDIFVKDLTTGVLTRVSSDTNGVPANAFSGYFTFASNDSVIFASDATNLLPTPDVNGARDLFIKSLRTDTGGVDSVNASVSYTLTANVENLTLTGTAAINGTGNALDNVITGNNANNTLDGGAGNDTLIGGLGGDLYIVDSALDVIQESPNGGTDTVQSALTQYLGANVENIILTGSNAVNGVGNSLDNKITGNSGDNTLNGNSGNDTLIGGLGNDLYVVDSSGDVVIEGAGAGIDSVRASFSYTLGANVENLILTGSAAINGIGNTLDNVITGNNAANTLNGGVGNDTLIGGLGNDLYVVDNTGDVVREGVGAGTDSVRASVNYTLSANVENLILTGAGAINGTGNALNNALTGNANDNLLAGGLGNDTLAGGGGNDVFVFNTALDAVSNVDVITDFNAGDKLQLSQLIFTQAGPAGSLASSAFTAGAGLTTGQDSDDRIIYNTTTGALYYDADGNGAGGAVLFAQLGSGTHPSLTATMIQVV